MPPKRILHVTSVLNHGGIENLLLNVLINIDKTEFVFDFLVIREDEGILEKEFLSLGSRIYKIPSLKKTGYFAFNKNLSLFFEKHPEYDTAHSHLNTLNGPVLNVAKKCGVKTRISHAHTAFPKYSFLESLIKRYFKTLIPKSATKFVSCSNAAGEWLHSGCANKVIANGIDLERFQFSKQKRSETRKSLNIEDNFVILNVGRFSKEKNHIFILEVFKRVLKIKDNALLICIGIGKEKENFLKKAKKCGLSEKIIVLIPPQEMEGLYCASDVYIAPSTFEGFGISVLEANACTLPSIVSDVFPEEIKSLPYTTTLSLSSEFDLWTREVLKNLNAERNASSKSFHNIFSAQQTANLFCDLY